MPDITSPLYSDIYPVVVAAWPETVPKPSRSGTDKFGVWEAEHLSMVPFSDLTPPYAVILVEDLSESEDLPTVDGYTATVDVYYVVAVLGPLSGIRAKIAVLRQELNQVGPLSNMQIERVTNLSWSDDLPLNRILAEKKIKCRGGRLRFRAYVGESFFATDLLPD